MYQTPHSDPSNTRLSLLNCKAMFTDSELEVTSRLHFLPFYACLKNVRKCTLIVVVHFVLRCYKYFFPATLSAVHTAQAEKQLESHPGFSACPVWTALRVAGKKYIRKCVHTFCNFGFTYKSYWTRQAKGKPYIWFTKIFHCLSQKKDFWQNWRLIHHVTF